METFFLCLGVGARGEEHRECSFPGSVEGRQAESYESQQALTVRSDDGPG